MLENRLVIGLDYGTTYTGDDTPLIPPPNDLTWNF
jgi:hypothetical protein